MFVSLRLEASRLKPWASKAAHLDATDHDSDDDHLDSGLFEDAAEGPHAGDEFDVLRCGHFEPSVTRAAVVARQTKTRPRDEDSMTLGEVVQELENVKGALRGLMLKLEEVESYSSGASKGCVDCEPTATGHGKALALGDWEGWRTAECGCSRRVAVASVVLVILTWRYAKASDRQ